jgi:hypothetical protein
VAARHAVLPHSNGALSRRPLGINPLQNPFGKDHGVCNDRMQSRRWPGALQLAELAGCQDRSHDPDHALAAFVHARQSSTFAFNSPSAFQDKERRACTQRERNDCIQFATLGLCWPQSPKGSADGEGRLDCG